MVRLACVALLVFAASQPIQTTAVVPFPLATNLTKGRLAGPTTVSPGRSFEVRELWWDLQDDVIYGIPVLLKEDKPTVVCCGLLLLLLTALACRSLRIRTQRGRHAEKVPKMIAPAADTEEPTEHPDHPAELHH